MRTNRTGGVYRLTSVGPEDLSGIGVLTQVQFGEKVMCLDHRIADISQRWFNWQMKNMPIQQAFDNLTPGEREFLITGITPEEWERLFSETEE
jgi:hypothetical protein